MAKLHIHPIGLAMIFFGLLSWVIALGGLAAATKFCRDNGKKDPVLQGQNVAAYCGNLYQLDWWAIWFEFFILLVMLITCFLNAFDRARHIYLSYLTLVTMMLTITAQKFIADFVRQIQEGSKPFSDYNSDANNAVAAGAVLLCITNYLLIIFVGLGATGGASLNMSISAPEQKYQPSNF